jgi:tRNA threonylcarbamoyladenosine biosynthesis protein TsaE
MSSSFTFHARSLADTDRIGAALAAALPEGATVALSGTLGAGKTRLVQAIAAALGIEGDSVLSPTFVLCQEYRGRRAVYHLDAYRIADDDEFLQLGVEEYFDSSALVFIEWAERVNRCLPRDHLQISIDVVGDTERQITVASHGDKFAPVVAAVAQHCEANKPAQ